MVRTRRRHEYKIIRRTKEKECYLDYIKVKEVYYCIILIEFHFSMKLIFLNLFNFVEKYGDFDCVLIKLQFEFSRN